MNPLVKAHSFLSLHNLCRNKLYDGIRVLIVRVEYRGLTCCARGIGLWSRSLRRTVWHNLDKAKREDGVFQNTRRSCMSGLCSILIPNIHGKLNLHSTNMTTKNREANHRQYPVFPAGCDCRGRLRSRGMIPLGILLGWACFAATFGFSWQCSTVLDSRRFDEPT